MTSSYDLVIRGGLVVDGFGGEGRNADVAVKDGRIALVGEVVGQGREELDAAGCIVTPGFVDLHTHYDGQVTWEHRMAPSSDHGVTTVVMGNCGVGFAPCRPDEREILIDMMEGVEDVPEVVMTTGLPWSWETFPQYLDFLEGRSFDLDVAAQAPHSALRVYAMGARGAQGEPPTSEDLTRMRELAEEALRAGAVGVSTSRNLGHKTGKGELVASLHSEEDELLVLAQALRNAGKGVFQLIPNIGADPGPEFALMRRLAKAAGRPLSFSLMQWSYGDPEAWRQSLDLLDEANDDGLPMRAQVFPRPVGLLYGLELSLHPFVFHPSFQPLRKLALAERVAAMRDPAVRAKLLAEQPECSDPRLLQVLSGFERAYPMSDPPDYEPDTADRVDAAAARLGVSTHEYAYDVLLRDDGATLLYLPTSNYRQGNCDAIAGMLAHPHTLLGLGDGGAHYGMICDASFPTYYLERWVRDAEGAEATPIGQAIRALTRQPAEAVGFLDRGALAPGLRADINVIDLDRLRLRVPRVVRDLPAGGARMSQKADGYVATLVAGEVTYREGVATGALPGRLVRAGR